MVRQLPENTENCRVECCRVECSFAQPTGGNQAKLHNVCPVFVPRITDYRSGKNRISPKSKPVLPLFQRVFHSL